MSWTIGVSTGSFFPFQTTERALHSIGEAGFATAELFVQTPSEYTALYGRRILRTMLMTGVKVYSIHVHSQDLYPFSPYAPRRADADSLFLQALDLASAIGARVVNWHGARQKELVAGLDREMIWETVARWQRWAQEAELILTLENVSWCMVRTPEEVGEVRRQLPDLHFTFDSFQAAESGVEPVRVASAMGDRVANVHLSDFDPHGARHLVPGQGKIDWAALLVTLAELRYQGPLVIELSHLDEEGYAEVLHRARRFLEGLIDQLELRLRLT